MIVSILLSLGYLFIVFRCVRKAIARTQLKFEEQILMIERTVNQLKKKKSLLNEQKIELENEALEIFTLYEITKEITRSLHEEEAFGIFKKKLAEHVQFKECKFLDPLSSEIKVLVKEGWREFPLKDKRQKVGSIVIKGLIEKDEEKFMILAHQFALALRRVKLYEEIERIAITDSLTGLHTRRYILERLREELQRSKMRNIKMSFLMIDIDFFKRFNDEHGHLTGDQILREQGNIINNNIREIDIAGRYGGEEFCVVLPDTDRQGAQYAAERIRQATEEANIKAYDTVIKLTVSVGTATFPDDGVKVDEIIDKADWALYRAKKQGRNLTCSFGVYDNHSKSTD